jgi:hypothetical protein
VTYACRLTHVRSMPPHNTRPLISPNRLWLPSRVPFACSQHRPHDAQARHSCPVSLVAPTQLTLSMHTAPRYTPLTHTRRIAAPQLFFLPVFLFSVWSYLKKEKAGVTACARLTLDSHSSPGFLKVKSGRAAVQKRPRVGSWIVASPGL